jgi:hypothetical protein
MKTVTILQPAYLPWLGFFNRIAQADLYIALDHVALDMSSKTKFTTRNKIRTQEGWSWLSVPICSKGKHGQLYIHEIEINHAEEWARKHWQTIRHNYAKTPYFSEHGAFFEQLYAQRWERLADLMFEIMRYLFQAFQITTPMQLSSTLAVGGTKDQLILNLCRAMGATTYISGPFGRDYLQEADFTAQQIQVVYDDYVHPTYPQMYSGFEPYMSAIDLLFNCGPEAGNILRTSVKMA